MVGRYNKLKNILGLTLIEAMVSVVIVGIGFISIFQMVNYSVRSIDVSGERTKTNFLVSMVAEDLMADKDQEYGGKNFHEYLLGTSNKGWRMGSCSNGTTSNSNFTNAPQNKMQKWDNRFSKKRIKCKGPNDIKALKIFDICHSSLSPNCNYVGPNDSTYERQLYYNKRYFGRMEVNLNNGKKRKYIYFQID
jgi:Tfp pilus assembly protein PilV|tara:strand:- start:1180 stop:1755 length:576 start_codon:yes stop_codon:yes gene_type:complete